MEMFTLWKITPGRWPGLGVHFSACIFVRITVTTNITRFSSTPPSTSSTCLFLHSCPATKSVHIHRPSFTFNPFWLCKEVSHTSVSLTSIPSLRLFFPSLLSSHVFLTHTLHASVYPSTHLVHWDPTTSPIQRSSPWGTCCGVRELDSCEHLEGEKSSLIRFSLKTESKRDFFFPVLSYNHSH